MQQNIQHTEKRMTLIPDLVQTHETSDVVKFT